MNTLTTTNTYFPRRDLGGSMAQLALVGAAAGMSAMVWLSMFGAGGPPADYVVAAAVGAPARITLPRVEVTGHRDALASTGETADVVGCAVDRSAQKRV